VNERAGRVLAVLTVVLLSIGLAPSAHVPSSPKAGAMPAIDTASSSSNPCTTAVEDFDPDGDWGETYSASAAGLSLTLGGLKASAQNPTVRLDPQNSTVSVGDTFTVTAMVDDALALGSFQFDLVYDPSVIWVEDITLGDFLGSTGRSVISLGLRVDNEVGKATFGAFSFGDQPGPDGSGALALVRLQAVGPGSSPLDLQDVQLTDTKANPQTPTVEDGTVTVSSTEGWHRIYLPLIVRNCHVRR